MYAYDVCGCVCVYAYIYVYLCECVLMYVFRYTMRRGVITEAFKSTKYNVRRTLYFEHPCILLSRYCGDGGTRDCAHVVTSMVPRYIYIYIYIGAWILGMSPRNNNVNRQCLEGS